MVDNLQIKEFVERIERLDGEQQTIGLDKKSVYDEAKKAGVNTKMLRRYISERKRDAKDSQTDKDALDAYRAALGEPGATYRSVAAKIGMPKSTLHRLVPKKRNGTGASDEPHDPATGVITTHERAADTAVAEDARQEVERRAGIEPVVSGLEDRSSAIELTPRSGAGESEDPACKAPADESCTTGDQPTPSETTESASGPPFSGDQPDDWDSIAQTGSELTAAFRSHRSAA